MREFLIVLLSIIGIGGVIAILLFMVIFPLINKMFLTNLPCFHGVWDELKINPIITREPKEEKEAKEDKEIKKEVKNVKPKENRDRDDKTKNKIAKRTDDLNSQKLVVKNAPAKNAVAKNVLTKNVAAKSAPPKPTYYDDKSVPTIKIPPIAKAPAKDTPLTLAKIEAASRKTTVMIDGQTFMEKNMEQKPEKPKPRKEDVDKLLMEKRLEEQRERLKKKMAEESKKGK